MGLITAVRVLSFLCMLASVTAAPAHAQWPSDPARPPVHAWLRGRLADPDLTESSAVVVSRAHPGVLWTLNDSGHAPDLFATDTLGRARGRVPVAARNVDWEALAPGPCPSGTCLYIGDTGDNAERRETVAIYRLPEPDPREQAVRRTRSLVFRYPDGAHDAEAMLITPDTAVWIITKGRSGGVRVYRLGPEAWGREGTATAALVQTLPIPTEEGVRELVTDAALSPDGRHVVIRTYATLYFLTWEGDRLLPEVPRPPCRVWGMETQGEGVAWLDGSRLVLTSERGVLGGGGSVYIVQCRE